MASTATPTSTQSRTVYARQGDTLDLLLHRHTGRTAGNTEATLAANRHLGQLGAVLPMGTAVQIVTAPAATRPGVINLWD